MIYRSGILALAGCLVLPACCLAVCLNGTYFYCTSTSQHNNKREKEKKKKTKLAWHNLTNHLVS